MSFDMNALLKQAQEMQEQMQQLQEEAARETAEASAGGPAATRKPRTRSSSSFAHPTKTSAIGLLVIHILEPLST